jgi:formate hydrogenlyase subunit 3/multisubunit Na+/H+ antiporter MnhD subunit
MLLTCLILLALGGTASVAAAPGTRWARPAAAVARWLLVAAAVAGAVAGGLGVAGRGERLDLTQLLVLSGTGGLRVDELSGLFLLISCAVAVPALLVSDRSRTLRPRLPAALALTLGAVVVVISADHLFVLLFGWESLTLGFYLLAGFDRQRRGRTRASIAAAVFGKASGAALLLGGALLAASAHSLALADLGAVTGTAQATAYALLLLGFAIKAGVVPVQVWLPPTYAAAPGPARPLMAGVAVNVAFYGMIRTLDVLGPPPVWLAAVVLLLAGVTALLGIAHASVNVQLTGLVAWSSVENAGLISTGFAMALVGSIEHLTALVAAGLLASVMQVIAHALGKSLLFGSTGLVEDAFDTVTLDDLRGIVGSLPVAGTGLVVGALTLAGLPLTAGFASEWLTLEALMQQFRVQSLALRLASAGAGALVALTLGIAGVTFVRLVALTVFGTPATRQRRSFRGGRAAARTGIIVLSAACLAVAALAPLEVRLVATGLRPLVGDTALDALASDAVLQPVYGDFSALSPTWLWVVLPAMTLLVLLLAAALSGRSLWRVRRVEPWTSASPGVARGTGYTSFGYANPMRRVLANLLRTRGRLESADEGSTFAATTRGAADSLTYRVDVVEVVEEYLYRPLRAPGRGLVRRVKRLQSGHLSAYLFYMLIALVAVLAVVAITT